MLDISTKARASIYRVPTPFYAASFPFFFFPSLQSRTRERVNQQQSLSPQQSTLFSPQISDRPGQGK
ncbi:hypothetical protein PoB_000242500 [Plakobranchus ocellatus]|uniref:Uncharacterized protein n=1 Tax=Plakobranchus ocellatus TaxID=259542 RepID=A0AAV3XYM0_9GAST|nr:hypothetical protein PoB_000242500 [Plakobranchus ocellatus]